MTVNEEVAEAAKEIASTTHIHDITKKNKKKHQNWCVFLDLIDIVCDSWRAAIYADRQFSLHFIDELCRAMTTKCDKSESRMVNKDEPVKDSNVIDEMKNVDEKGNNGREQPVDTNEMEMFNENSLKL